MKKTKASVHFKTAKMQKWYEEMIFLTEVIAKIYSYMASHKRVHIKEALGMLQKKYGATNES